MPKYSEYTAESKFHVDKFVIFFTGKYVKCVGSLFSWEEERENLKFLSRLSPVLSYD